MRPKTWGNWSVERVFKHKRLELLFRQIRLSSWRNSEKECCAAMIFIREGWYAQYLVLVVGRKPLKIRLRWIEDVSC